MTTDKFTLLSHLHTETIENRTDHTHVSQMCSLLNYVSLILWSWARGGIHLEQKNKQKQSSLVMQFLGSHSHTCVTAQLSVNDLCL